MRLREVVAALRGGEDNAQIFQSCCGQTVCAEGQLHLLPAVRSLPAARSPELEAAIDDTWGCGRVPIIFRLQKQGGQDLPPPRFAGS